MLSKPSVTVARTIQVPIPEGFGVDVTQPRKGNKIIVLMCTGKCGIEIEATQAPGMVIPDEDGRPDDTTGQRT